MMAELLRSIVFLSFLLYLSYCDWKTGYLYDYIVYPFLGFGLLFSLLLVPQDVGSVFLGGLAGGGTLWLIRVMSRGRMGGGDVKLCLALGVWLGFPVILPALLLAFLSGSVVGLLLCWKKGSWQAEIPFGPFLSTGAAIGFFFGNRICQMYEALF
jgi:leader peptidase (prepilin peptidase)/N-methyltransferase